MIKALDKKDIDIYILKFKNKQLEKDDYNLLNRINNNNYNLRL